jgi:uncharacterized protein YfiM (DUF2279 family)
MKTAKRFLAVAMLAVVGFRLAYALPRAASLAAAQAPAVQVPVAPVIDAERVRKYQERIASGVARLAARPSLAQLLPMVLRAAGDESSNERIVEDHRAALLALTFYVNNWPIEAMVPEARGWPRASRRNTLLRGRHDLAQHFTVSAVVSAFAGTAIANAVGLSKEMDDLRRTSGFSFSDLAADRAGTLLGEMATGSAESARRLQAQLSSLNEDDFMPAVAGLPDNLTPAEFTRRYGDVGSPAYTRLIDEIDRRIAALPLYQ